METSHRQQKKAQTRQALLAAALALFAEKGFDKTTIADIAARANCAPRTFFLYFDSKEALLPAAMEAASQNLVAAMSARGNKSTTDALHDWLLAMLANHKNGSLPDVSEQDSGFLARRKFHFKNLLQPILAAEFAKDLGMPQTAPQPQLIAAMAMAAFEAFDFNLNHKQRLQFVEDAMSVLRAGSEMLQAKH